MSGFGADVAAMRAKSKVPLAPDLLVGHVQVAFNNTPNALPQVKAGKLRALAVTSATRSEVVPDVPTVAEAGVPGYEVSVCFGIVAPAGTPPAELAGLKSGPTRVDTFDTKFFSAGSAQHAGVSASSRRFHIRANTYEARNRDWDHGVTAPHE
jgi:hypothetical protein